MTNDDVIMEDLEDVKIEYVDIVESLDEIKDSLSTLIDEVSDAMTKLKSINKELKKYDDVTDDDEDED